MIDINTSVLCLAVKYHSKVDILGLILLNYQKYLKYPISFLYSQYSSGVMIENLEDFNLTCYLHLNIIMRFYVSTI